MSRFMLFDPPKAFTDRLDELKDEPQLNNKTAALLMQVELAFELMAFLGLDDEPVTSPWVILSGVPIRHSKLDALSSAHRRAIANIRQISPFSARFTWINALRDYREIHEKWRNYDLLSVEGEEIELPEHSIREQKNIRQTVHDGLYKQCLAATLDYKRRPLADITPGESYEFRSRKKGGAANLSVVFPKESVSKAQASSVTWFSEPCKTSSLSITLADLAAVAEALDIREQALAKQYGWPQEALGNWVRRFSKIDFRGVNQDMNLVKGENQPIELDGFLHIAGMVGSGKTTLILLLAAYLYRHHPQQRITLVVGDVQSAIRLANQINSWFCAEPEEDTPVATPILGKGTTDKNLRGFSQSRDYLEHQKRGQPHWGERWLNPACPLQSLLGQNEIYGELDSLPLLPGSEPCHSLKIPTTGNRKFVGRSYGCPFFTTCPSKQAYRDLPTSNIWITTPGAMATAGLPRQLEDRPIKVGGLIYEQSNIVVFDEVETVSQWFDNVYAKPTVLVNEKDGVFDSTSIPTEAYMNSDRVPPVATQRWTGAERDALKAVTATLTLLSQGQGHQYLKDWVARGYFTPYILLYRFSRRLSGFPEFDGPDVSEADRTARSEQVGEIMDHFEQLIRNELLEVSYHAPSEVISLSAIVGKINRLGASGTNRQVHYACKSWIENFFSKTEEKLSKLKLQAQQRSKDHNLLQGKSEEAKVDNLTTLAYRLQFALTVCLLDLHTRMTLYEWQNSPPTVDDEPMQRRMPPGMMNILPLPTTGRQFGTYYAQPKTSSGRSNNVLSLFAYTNIGRHYVLNFHQLLTDLDARRGPNVLGLSGTSYLPHSTKFHLEHPPKGVLLPETKASEAIAQSTFSFIPQYKEDQPIRISGIPEAQKKEMFQEIVRSLVQTSQHLPQTLESLSTLGVKDRKHWQDRDRILLLVNSYEQALWAANDLHKCWPQQRSKIYHLARNTDDFGEAIEPESFHTPRSQPLKRSDIESFAQTNGKILVAPLQAIGRGFNILNSHGQAAFGAVYFLTRPYPHPQDVCAIAQEMNRRATDWVKNETFDAWAEETVTKCAEALRRTAKGYWRSVEQRAYYKTLIDDDEKPIYVEKLGAHPRKDLAATTIGLVIQAAGRLLRGGVPFKGYFVDSAWAPQSALPEAEESDTDKTSLLVAMILRICDYASEPNTVGYALYKPLADSLQNTDGLRTL